jgi:hypothetical protein
VCPGLEVMKAEEILRTGKKNSVSSSHQTEQVEMSVALGIWVLEAGHANGEEFAIPSPDLAVAAAIPDYSFLSSHSFSTCLFVEVIPHQSSALTSRGTGFPVHPNTNLIPITILTS